MPRSYHAQKWYPELSHTHSEATVTIETKDLPVCQKTVGMSGVVLLSSSFDHLHQHVCSGEHVSTMCTGVTCCSHIQQNIEAQHGHAQTAGGTVDIFVVSNTMQIHNCDTAQLVDEHPRKPDNASWAVFTCYHSTCTNFYQMDTGICPQARKQELIGSMQGRSSCVYDTKCCYKQKGLQYSSPSDD